ncbi:MAG: redoxin domain-containing protein [Proteobacteria bacterium]|nr:redoxin domain-containing protein [Pseudomonadota bacterium]
MMMLSTLIFAFFIAAPADAADLLIRDLGGSAVTADADGTVLLFFSMTESESTRELRVLSKLERQGLNVLAVSTDDATQRSRVRPHLRRLGLNVAAAHDPTQQLCQSLQVRPGDAVFVRVQDGRQQQWSDADLNQLQLPDVVEEQEPVLLVSQR